MRIHLFLCSWETGQLWRSAEEVIHTKLLHRRILWQHEFELTQCLSFAQIGFLYLTDIARLDQLVQHLLSASRPNSE